MASLQFLFLEVTVETMFFVDMKIQKRIESGKTSRDFGTFNYYATGELRLVTEG